MSGYPMAEGQTRHDPPLSMYRRAGDYIYISGHGAVSSKGEFVSPNFEEQMRYTMDQLRATFAEAGCTSDQVMMVRSYVNNPANLPRYNQIYPEYFNAPYPARTTITSCLPLGLEFEIDCVVYLGDEK